MKICLACSAGGHLDEILQLRPFFSKHKYFFISFRRADTESLAKREKIHFLERPARNPLTTLIDFFRAIKILRNENPDVIISTGADVAVPVCYAAKLLGKKIIFIESFCRPFKPSISGRLVYPIANLFIIQWRALQRFYPRAKFGGSIF